jgi:hypothetical protein
MYILLRINVMKGKYVSSFYLDDPGKRSCYSDSLRAEHSGDQIPVLARLYESFQTGYGAELASYTMGKLSIPGVQGPGRGADHSPTSSVEVKERLQ